MLGNRCQETGVLIPFGNRYRETDVWKPRGCKGSILVQTHKCSLLIMGLHIFSSRMRKLLMSFFSCPVSQILSVFTFPDFLIYPSARFTKFPEFPEIPKFQNSQRSQSSQSSQSFQTSQISQNFPEFTN